MEEKIQSSRGANQTIYESIRKIAWHRIVNDLTETFRGTERKIGYVCKIHTDEDDELLGTVDVQEFNSQHADGSVDGLHEGVKLSAIQNNKNGMLLIPMLYSEVVIGADPATLAEYVLLYSHVDTVQIESHQSITIGVTETEELDLDDDDSPDYDKLEKTGEHAHTSFDKNSILSKAVGSKKESSLLISDEKIEAKHDKASSTLTDDSNTHKYNNSEVSIADKKVAVQAEKVYLGADNVNEPAVLGNQLASLMIEFLDSVSQIKTMTQIGAQPPLNMAKFIVLKAKINSYKRSVSGFLSKTVKVKE